MPPVTIKDGTLWVADQRIPLFAGEVHYWRLNPARWPDVLRTCRRLGLNVIATYVPWEYHELAPGRFDFAGETEPPRNLTGFLDLLAREDFWVFIRPGPFIYAEWTNAGVPDRVVTLPRLSDAYRREAAVWMQAVSEVIKPHLATRGGRIAVFQPDNEMDLFSHWFEEPSGLAAAPGFFHDFLREAYGDDVQALNAAWGTHYARIDDARAWTQPVDALDPHHLARRRDYWRFQHYATREGVRWHADEYRRLGIDVPMVANYYPGGDVQNWREVAKVVDTIGIDWYPQNEFAGDPSHHRNFLDSCRYQRSLTPLPFIAEFECGAWHGWHYTTGALVASHYRLMGVSALLAGIKAFNWYMFVARDNWLYSPVNERGLAQPEAQVFADLHRVVADIDPPTLEKLTDTCALFEPVHIGTDNILAENPTLQALYDADIDFEVFDPEVGAIEKPLMFYAAAEWLPRASQQRLIEYIEAGGHLVICQRHPQRDECFQRCNELGIAPPDRVLSRLGKRVDIALGSATAAATGGLWVYDNPPGDPIVATQTAATQQAVENADRWMLNYVGKQWTIGYRQQRGRGSLTVIGAAINASIVRGVHDMLGLARYAQAELPGVTTAIFRQGGDFVLMATNLNDAAIQARIRLSGVSLPERFDVVDLWSQTTTSATPDTLVVDIPHRSAGTWRLRCQP